MKSLLERGKVRYTEMSDGTLHVSYIALAQSDFDCIKTLLPQIYSKLQDWKKSSLFDPSEIITITTTFRSSNEFYQTFAQEMIRDSIDVICMPKSRVRDVPVTLESLEEEVELNREKSDTFWHNC